MDENELDNLAIVLGVIEGIQRLTRIKFFVTFYHFDDIKKFYFYRNWF